MSDTPKILFTVKDAAHLLSCCPETVRRLISKGYLKAVSGGRMLRIHKSEMDKFSKYVAQFGLPSVWDKSKPWPEQRQALAGAENTTEGAMIQ